MVIGFSCSTCCADAAGATCTCAEWLVTLLGGRTGIARAAGTVAGDAEGKLLATPPAAATATGSAGAAGAAGCGVSDDGAASAADPEVLAFGDKVGVIALEEAVEVEAVVGAATGLTLAAIVGAVSGR